MTKRKYSATGEVHTTFCGGCHRYIPDGSWSRHTGQQGRCFQFHLQRLLAKQRPPETQQTAEEPEQTIMEDDIESFAMEIDGGIEADINCVGDPHCLAGSPTPPSGTSSPVPPLLTTPDVLSPSLSCRGIFSPTADIGGIPSSPGQAHTSTENVSHVNKEIPFTGLHMSDGSYREIYAGDGGKMFHEQWTSPLNSLFPDAERRQKFKDDPFWPCASRMEFQMLSILFRLGCSSALLNELLSTEFFQSHPQTLSFKNALELKAKIELLPSGPSWSAIPVQIDGYTTTPVTFYGRDGLECVSFLYGNPLFADKMEHIPYKSYTDRTKSTRQFGSMMSSDWAHEMQKSIDLKSSNGALLGVILSSDKTVLSVGSGDQAAHPIYLSLANISPEIRSKDSHRAYMLVGLLPIVKFPKHPELATMLNARLQHWCLDHVVASLKRAAAEGEFMRDPLGNVRRCHTPLASYEVDIEEALKLAGLAKNMSHITLATQDSFGDPEQSEPRHGVHTLNAINEVNRQADPWGNLPEYLALSKQYGLIGVHEPFWRDWEMSNPAYFFTPDALHGWHKQFFDHDFGWIKRALGAREVDFRYSCLQPVARNEHFNTGVTKLQKVGGETQRNLHRYHMPAIDGLPNQFQLAITALTKFRYWAQLDVVPDYILQKMNDALTVFHDNKAIIRDKNYKKSAGWKIPKLEGMLNVAKSITHMGASQQYSTERPERAHKEIKVAWRISNRRAYESQIIRSLDCAERLRVTALFQALATEDFADLVDERDDVDGDLDSADQWLSWINGDTAQKLSAPQRKYMDYFQLSVALPIRRNTFCTYTTAYHFMKRSKLISISEATELYKIPDFRAALGDYFIPDKSGHPHWYNPREPGLAIGGRRVSTADVQLPYSHVRVWPSFRIQNRSVQAHRRVLPSTKLHASHPDDDWPFGRGDTCVVRNDMSSDFKGPIDTNNHCIGIVKMVFQLKKRKQANCDGPYLAYVERFDVLGHHPANEMYILRKSRRANGTPIGDVVSIEQLTAGVEIAPQFGKRANRLLASNNCLHNSLQLYLNHYCDKEVFYMFEL